MSMSVMLHLMLVWTLAVGMQTAPTSPGLEAQDLAVMKAVADETILKAAEKLHGAALPAESKVLILDRTLRVCGSVEKEYHCVRPWELNYLSQKSAFTGGEAELPQAFVSRNAASAALTEFPGGAVLSPTEVVRELIATGGIDAVRSRYAGAIGFVEFSLPGYVPGGGVALIYARYYCGTTCGYGWYVRVKREEDGWRVASARVLWVS